MRHDPACPQGSRFTKWGPGMCVCHIVARTRAETNNIMTHDPFCPARNRSTAWEPEMCVCDVIANARADERETIAQSIEQPEDDCLLCGMAWQPKPCNDEQDLRNIAKFIRESES